MYWLREFIVFTNQSKQILITVLLNTQQVLKDTGKPHSDRQLDEITKINIRWDTIHSLQEVGRGMRGQVSRSSK